MPQYLKQSFHAVRYGLMLTSLLALFLAERALAEPIEWKTIPTEICKGLWLVPVTPNSTPDEHLNMVLDTGATHTIVDPKAVQRVFGRKVPAGKKIRLKDLHAGPLKLRSIRVETSPLGHLSRALGSQIDGILGFDIFQNFLLKLDYPNGQVQVTTGSLPAIDNHRIFKDAGTRRPYLNIEVGGQPTPVLVDSGSVDGLTLRQADSIEWETPPRPLSAAVRFRSIEIESTGRAAGDYLFGPLRLERPTIEVTESGSRLAGWKILHRFEWIFDPQNRRIQMTPDTGAPIHLEPLRGIGIAFRPLEAGLEVAHIFADTPGSASEIQVGDIVTAIDGIPVYERGCRTLYETVDQPKLVLTVERQDKPIDVTVELAVLVP